jgi:hypothetical protein
VSGHVRTEDALHRVQEERNILNEINRRKANWIGRILRGNCLLKHDIGENIEGMVEVKERRGRGS